ncbi:MAG TPA: hypothetical protein VIJ53_16145 [Acidobacteriaceae bacterium]
MKKPLPVATARSRQLGNDCTQTGPSLEETFFDEVLNHLLRRIRVNLEFRSERSHGREGLTRLKLTADKCFCGGENNLIEN